MTDFAAPVFGIKAKPSAPKVAAGSHFAAPVFGIKAKLISFSTDVAAYFAAPVFGIKAKPALVADGKCSHFAAPVFGIKAKRKPAAKVVEFIFYYRHKIKFAKIIPQQLWPQAFDSPDTTKSIW